MGSLLNTSLNPEDVAGRIQQTGRNIDRGTRKKTRPLYGGDVVGQSLADLEGQVGERLRQGEMEKEEAQLQKEEVRMV